MQTREKVRRAMKARGIKQTPLAKQMGVGQGTISSWLSGRHAINVDSLMALAKAITQLAPEHPPVTGAQLLPDEDEEATPPTHDDEE